MRKLFFRIIAFTLIPATVFFMSFFCPAEAIVKNHSNVEPGFDGIVAGTIVIPPFTVKKSNQNWEGLSIDLLRLVAKKLNTEFKVQEYESIPQIRDALINGEIDLAPAAILSEKYEVFIDYTHPYYQSGSAIAVKSENQGHELAGIMDYLVSKHFLKLILVLLLLWASAGFLVWLFERRRLKNMFGDNIIEGLGHGIWWAAVTMTTVGYGDKAPETPGGRTVAVIWMLVSVILIASFTASITTSLTIDALQSKVNGFDDLHNVTTGTIAYSLDFELLKDKGINPVPYNDIQSGMRAVEENQITAFVFEAPVLKYYLKTENFSRLYVLPETFNHHYVGMAVSEKSPVLEKLNQSILEVMKTDAWKKLLYKYFGS